MDKANQMEFLFEEGGMADDGLDRDPVSGNEVPSGSMSEEVRDDIPAQLSEGEYVVPADVVRYFGVKYFEDLRDDAKMGLTQMEQEGRIGGEPVDVEGDDTELTAEEQAELDAIMGMAEGGAVTTTYDRLPPQAVGNTGQEQQLASVEQQMTRAFQEGGAVPAATQVVPNFSNFGAGYSFGINPATGQPYTPPVAETGRNVTLYGPQGQVVNLILPQDQARYDELTAQGYGETPVAAPVVQQPQVQQEQESASDVTDGYEFQRAQSRFETGAYKEGEDFGRIDSGVGYMTASELNLLETDPLAYGRAEMSTNFGLGRALGAGIGLINPVMGLLAGGGMARSEAQALNRATTALRMAEQGMGRTYTQEEIEAYEAELDKARANAGRLARMFPGEPDRFDEELMGLYRRSVAIRDFQNPIAGLSSYGGTRLSARREGLANAMGPGGILAGSPGAQSLAESMDSGYTGAGYRDIAVGKIAGEGQTEGVETRMGSVQGFNDPMPVVVRTAREDGNKVIRRDDQGRPFVYAGAFDKTREYLDEGEAARAGVDMPDNYQEPSQSDTTEDKASVICTALFNKGLLSKEIFMLDNLYGRMLESSQPEVTYGYRKLATPLANYIQKDTLGATIARTLVAPVAKAWANEMAHQMQPENYKGNLLGKAIIKLGYPVCAFVGKRSKEIVYGT